MKKTMKQLIAGFALAALTLGGSAFGFQAPAAKATTKAAAAPKADAAPKAAAAAAPSDADIAAAKAKGLVWVNTGTKVYHKDGEFYGKTKAGKFMTEDDATKAGFHAAKQPGGTKATVAKKSTKK